VDAFVDAVLAELAAMEADGTKPTWSGPKLASTGAALCKAIMAIRCLCFCGIQWRAIGLAVRHPVWHALHTVRPMDPAESVTSPAQSPDPGLAAGSGGKRVPTAVIIDSPLSVSASGQLSGERSCPSAPSCFTRGFDGGKKIKGIKVHLAVDKYAKCGITHSLDNPGAPSPPC
jgi:hypothetical protein